MGWEYLHPSQLKHSSAQEAKSYLAPKTFPGAIPDHLVVTRKLINEHPEQVQALVDSWFATLDYIKANPAQAIAIMAKRAGVSIAEYKEYAQGTHIFSIEENLKAFQPGTDRTSSSFCSDRNEQVFRQSWTSKAEARS